MPTGTGCLIRNSSHDWLCHSHSCTFRLRNVRILLEAALFFTTIASNCNAFCPTSFHTQRPRFTQYLSWWPLVPLCATARNINPSRNLVFSIACVLGLDSLNCNFRSNHSTDRSIIVQLLRYFAVVCDLRSIMLSIRCRHRAKRFTYGTTKNLRTFCQDAFYYKKQVPYCWGNNG